MFVRLSTLEHYDFTEKTALVPKTRVKLQRQTCNDHLIATATAIERLIMGEGIEKVASVWVEFKRVGRDLSTTAFWSSVAWQHGGTRGRHGPTSNTDDGGQPTSASGRTRARS
jgi:hypothetical protein